VNELLTIGAAVMFLVGSVCGFLLGIAAMFRRAIRVTDEENRRQRDTIIELRTTLMNIDAVCGEIVNGLTPPFTHTQATADSVRRSLECMRGRA
jgi:hypothetical protein